MVLGVKEECAKISSELETVAASGKILGEEEAALRLQQIARLFFRAAQHYEKGAVYPLIHSLGKLGDVSPERLNNFIHGAHGVTNIWEDLAITKSRNDAAAMQRHLVYAGMKWGGAAECISHVPTIKNTQIRVGGINLSFNSEGKFLCDKETLVRLIKIMPHAEAAFLPKISVEGRTMFSLAQAFVIARNASDSMHSIALRRIFSAFRGALSEWKNVERTVERLSSREQFLERARLSRGERDIKNKYDWKSLGLIPPEKKAAVLAELRNRDFRKWDTIHRLALCEATKLPEDQVSLYWNRYVDFAKDKAHTLNYLLSLKEPKRQYVGIDLKKAGRAKIVTVDGMLVKLSEMLHSVGRLGKRTSAPVREGAANEVLVFGKRSVTSKIRWKQRVA